MLLMSFTSSDYEIRILACGDRFWIDRGLIKKTFMKYDVFHPILIHGSCRGADLLSQSVALELGWKIWPFPADWKRYGNAAGPIRNKQMLIEGHPSIVMAFHDDIDHSKGTKNMIEQSHEVGLSVLLVSHIGVEVLTCRGPRRTSGQPQSV